MQRKEYYQELAGIFKQLDENHISVPIEVVIGDDVYTPSKGFLSLFDEPKFSKLSERQLATLHSIANDLQNMSHPSIWEAFVKDDGIIVIDRFQEQIEYSVDIQYNAARTRVEGIYPQVSYPQEVRKAKYDQFFRNNTVHEVAHHADFWLDAGRKPVCLEYMHSHSTLFQLLAEWDMALHPEGVCGMIHAIRQIEGYDPQTLINDGFSMDHVERMLNAELFAICAEFYYGRKQDNRHHSPMLEVYMREILGLDIDVQEYMLPLMDIEAKRGILRRAIYLPFKVMVDEFAGDIMLRNVAADVTRNVATYATSADAFEASVVSWVQNIARTCRHAMDLPYIAEREQ